jgi:uncharacterized protein YggU (UPF0235/DUF167 family)
VTASEPKQRHRFAVRLTPKGGRDAIDGWRAGADGKAALAVRVAAAPEDGRANAALIALLARFFELSKGRIRIVTGATARLKIVEIDAAPEILERLTSKVPA